MPKPRKSGQVSPTPLDAKQQALLKEQEKVRAQMEKLTVFVEKAPEMKKQAEERRRAQIVERASRGSRRIDTPVLLDRYDSVLAAPSPRPAKRRGTLKAKKRQDRLTFFTLLVALLVLSFWVWTVWR